MHRKITTRKSFILLIAIALCGIFAPFLAQVPPDAITGSPFARPAWSARGMSRSREYHITEKTLDFTWNMTPPAVFALKGRVKTNANAEITWQTPDKSYLLARLEAAGEHWINIDARDMIFKQALGLPLISHATDFLFPSHGKYAIIINTGSDSDAEIDLTLSLKGECQGLLGTDQRGRDVASRLLYGIRTSLLIGIAATLAASLLGMFFGLAAGYFGGLCDVIIMRVVDILMSIPTLPILIVMAAVWGHGLWQLIVIMSVFSWMGTARSIRSLVLTIRESAWVEALRALGASPWYILHKHLAAETAPILLANVALGVPGAILSEAGLAFLGLSDPRLISWGRMLHEAHIFGAFTEGAWWLILPPGIGIVVICLIFMDMGKFLEEQIDPRLK